MVEIPPNLKPGEKEVHVIAHDEVCFHTNDLSKTEWVAGRDQPLRQKGRGRIIHVSDFILERTGRLSLTESEREAQMKLPSTPGSTVGESSVKISMPTGEAGEGMEKQGDAMMGKTKKGRKKKKSKDKPSGPTGTSASGRTFAENSNWDPRAVSEESFRLPSFDARRIIYPGANGDAWWDMPQLVAQVSPHFHHHNQCFIKRFRRKMPFLYSTTNFRMPEPSLSLIAHRPMSPTHQMPSLHTR